MIHDNNQSTRELGWRKVLKAREFGKNKLIRSFKTPEINFQATCYHQSINWQNNITEPHFLDNIESSDIRTYIDTRNFPNLNKSTFEIPCHSQAVERHIKIVTEASSRVCGHDRRDGMVRSIIKSRGNMKKFETKCQFNI